MLRADCTSKWRRGFHESQVTERPVQRQEGPSTSRGRNGRLTLGLLLTAARGRFIARPRIGDRELASAVFVTSGTFLENR